MNSHQLKSNNLILTDGGLETTLIYQEHIALPHFAAFELLMREKGIKVLKEYYDKYLAVAAKYSIDFILETPTWRANPDWGKLLGYTESDLEAINAGAVELMRILKREWEYKTGNILISGNIGPRGDGYVPGSKMSITDARRYHAPQIQTFAAQGVDHVTAMTLNYITEAAGIAWASRNANVPVVISFTVETNGKLPSGESLQEAIEKTDRLTDEYVSYYMINCAHPTHFSHILDSNASWTYRIRGVRANASIKSHNELDASTVLDSGDKELLSNEYHSLLGKLSSMQIIGGCCGTDHTHIEAICQSLLHHAA